jgi:hypothetical protein
MLLMVLFFIFRLALPPPQFTLETLVLWWWLFLSPLVRLYMGSPAMDGELGPFDWGFFGPCFFSLPLSLSVVLVPQLVCSFMETLKMSETLISRD